MADSSDSLPLIGWKERVDFVDWDIRRVKAKIDTGARTSALGVDHYELREDPDQGLIAELRLSLFRRHPERTIVVQVPVLKMVEVCNSGGQREHRPLVETRLRLGTVVKSVLLTITRRDAMLFPMILGRKALEGDFAVDVSRKYVLRKKGIAN
jgi:hypothetical protein